MAMSNKAESLVYTSIRHRLMKRMPTPNKAESLEYYLASIIIILCNRIKKKLPFLDSTNNIQGDKAESLE